VTARELAAILSCFKLL